MNRFTRNIAMASARHPWRTLATWVVVLGAVFGLAGSGGGTFIDAFPGAVVELTGCRRVVAVKTGGLVGYLSAADAAALGALADRAVG